MRRILVDRVPLYGVTGVTSDRLLDTFCWRVRRFDRSGRVTRTAYVGDDFPHVLAWCWLRFLLDLTPRSVDREPGRRIREAIDK